MSTAILAVTEEDVFVQFDLIIPKVLRIFLCFCHLLDATLGLSLSGVDAVDIALRLTTVFTTYHVDFHVFLLAVQGLEARFVGVSLHALVHSSMLAGIEDHEADRSEDHDYADDTETLHQYFSSSFM